MSFNISGGFDPDTNLKLHGAVLLLAGINATYGLGIARLLSLPAIAWVLARWVFMFLSWLKHRAYENALSEWNGRYFEHEGQQVRIYWDDTETWIACADVFRLLGRSPDTIERKKITVRVGAGHLKDDDGLETACFSSQGVMKYLASLKEEETRAFRRWLERQVFPIVQRHRETGNNNYRQYQLNTGNKDSNASD